MLKEGDKAPNFKSTDQDGNSVKLSDFKGQRLVLYFYPKDDTPGCTKEACSFRDADDVFRKKGIKVLGVSTDIVKREWRTAKAWLNRALGSDAQA